MMLTHIRDRFIEVRQSKTGVSLEIPIHPQLAESIAVTPRTGPYLLETKFGPPFSAKGFGGRFTE